MKIEYRFSNTDADLTNNFQGNDGVLSSADATVYITEQASDSDGDGNSDGNNNDGNGGGCLIGSARR